MTEHEFLTQRLRLQVFFADPHSLWQWGTDKNMNEFLRQYLLKGMDLSIDSQRDLNTIAPRLNIRPRKCPALPRCLRSFPSFVMIHPLHLDLGTACLLDCIFKKLNTGFGGGGASEGVKAGCFTCIYTLMLFSHSA